MHGVIMPYVSRSQQKPATHEVYKFVPDIRHFQSPQSGCHQTEPNGRITELNNGFVSSDGGPFSCQRADDDNEEVATKEATLAEYASVCQKMTSFLTTQDDGNVTKGITILNGEIHHDNVEALSVILDRKPTSESRYIAKSNDMLQQPGVHTFLDPKQHSFLGKLREMAELSKSVNSVHPAMQMVEKDAMDLNSDVLLSNLQRVEFLKPCFDIVCSNVSSKNIRCLELGKAGLSKKCQELLPPFLSMTKCAATVDDELVEQMTETAPDIEIINWKPVDKVPESLVGFNLVVCDNVLRKQANLRTALKGVSDVLNEGGFVLIQEVTSDFQMANLLDALDNTDNNITTHNADREERSQGIYCDTVKWRKLFSESGFELICEVTDVMLMSLFLLRKRNTSGVERQTFLELTKGDTFDWLSQLKTKVEDVSSRPKGENLWLISDDSCSGILGMVNCLRNEPGGDKLR